jgi:YD repeat-containing protein
MKFKWLRGVRRILSVCVASGVLAFVAVPVVAITYAYDSLNRLIKVTYDDGGIVEYEYDAAGNITRVIETPARIKQGKPKETESTIDEGPTDSKAKQIESSPSVKTTREQ